MKALLLVAHPDDETIFAGNLLLEHHEWEWTVVCCTYTRGGPRGLEFTKAISAFKVEGVNIVRTEMLGLRDDEGDMRADPPELWEHRIATVCDGYEFDAVYTHNRGGDYGHKHHRLVNACARRIFPEPIWEFYLSESDGGAEPWLGAEGYYLQDERKIHVFNRAYAHRLDSLVYHLPEMMTYLVLKGQEMHTCASL